MNKIQIGKIISFVIFTFGFGLVQLWTLCLMIYFKNEPINLSKILGDGGLYFFSTSLAFSSFLALLNKKSITAGNIHLIFTLLFVTPLSLTAVVAYVTVLTKVGNAETPFSSHLNSQFACLVLSSIYAFYVATVTGLFEKNL